MDRTESINKKLTRMIFDINKPVALWSQNKELESI